jgi:hypothetical protein
VNCAKRIWYCRIDEIGNRLFLIIFLAIANMIPGSAQSTHDSVVVTMETEEGNLRIFLFTKEAPVTCANFLKYVEQLITEYRLPTTDYLFN